VSDTPIIDAATKAGSALRHNTFRNLVIAALREALPWEPPTGDRHKHFWALLRELYPEKFR
jgi:hypothetical protein